MESFWHKENNFRWKKWYDITYTQLSCYCHWMVTQAKVHGYQNNFMFYGQQSILCFLATCYKSHIEWPSSVDVLGLAYHAWQGTSTHTSHVHTQTQTHTHTHTHKHTDTHKCIHIYTYTYILILTILYCTGCVQNWSSFAYTYLGMLCRR